MITQLIDMTHGTQERHSNKTNKYNRGITKEPRNTNDHTKNDTKSKIIQNQKLS